MNPNTFFSDIDKTILEESGFIVQLRMAHLIGEFQKADGIGRVQFICSVHMGISDGWVGMIKRKIGGGLSSTEVNTVNDKDLSFVIAQLLQWKLVEETKILLS